MINVETYFNECAKIETIFLRYKTLTAEQKYLANR